MLSEARPIRLDIWEHPAAKLIAVSTTPTDHIALSFPTRIDNLLFLALFRMCLLGIGWLAPPPVWAEEPPGYDPFMVQSP
jgi:hypothetical protein